MLIINVSNRYTIAMTDIESRNWNYYTLYVGQVIRDVMQDMGYSQEQIQKYFQQISITKFLIARFSIIAYNFRR